MVIFDPSSISLSRIGRLLRPLRCKCVALSTYMKDVISITTTYGTRSYSQSVDILPLCQLEVPTNIGVRIHFSKDTVQTLELSKKIYAVRDSYVDILTRLQVRAGSENNGEPTVRVPSLTDICAAILGSSMPSEEDYTEPEESTEVAEEIYGAIPFLYRPQTLITHALHIVLDTCPPQSSLYLALFDVTLQWWLLHESELLVNHLLHYAFASPRDNVPRIAHPAHCKFLVDLYRKWSSRFPPPHYARLVVMALRDVPSDVVWTTKALRRLARKLFRDNLCSFSVLFGGLADMVASREVSSEAQSVGTRQLEQQLGEWFSMGLERCTSSIRRDSPTLLAGMNNSFLIDDMLHDCQKSLAHRKISRNKSTYNIFCDLTSVLYTLKLATAIQEPIDSNLHRLLQDVLLSTTAFDPICLPLFRTRAVFECSGILETLSTVLRINGLDRLKASLWACALRHVEEPEIEQLLLDKSGRTEVSNFRLSLVDRVDEAERSCFSSRETNKESTDLSIPFDKDHNRTQWIWEPSMGCWFRRDSDSDSEDEPCPPKRRKLDRHSSCPPTPFMKAYSLRSSSGNGFAAGDCSPRKDKGPTRVSPPVPRRNERGNSVPTQFASILTDALSSRTVLHRDAHNRAAKSIYTISDDEDAEHGRLGIDDDDESEVDYGQHETSEDLLDLLRSARTSSPC